MGDGEDGVARLGALLAPSGQELLARLGREDVSAGNALRVGTLLRAEYPADLVRDALAQHELRERARAKFSRAGDMFFTRAGLEQASSEPIARHRARRYAGVAGAAGVADLCCGIGGDLIALASDGPVLAVDRDPLHLAMAQANAAAYGVAGRVSAVTADVREADLAGLQAVFVDPARRTGHRRLRAGDSEPPLGWCLGLAGRIARVGIKAAPGVPHEIVPPGWELEFIAIGRELKEAVLWSPAMASAARRATILPTGHTLPGDTLVGDTLAGHTPTGDTLPGDTLVGHTPAGHTFPGHTLARSLDTAAGEPAGPGAAPGVAPAVGPVPVRPPGEFLFDPNPAVTRAGLVQDLALQIGAWKIDDQIAFLSADTPVRTPFARVLRVIDSAPWDQKRLPARLRALDVGAADIRRRGLAGDVDRLHRQLRLSGTRRVTLVMTRVADRPWALVCQDPDLPG